MWILFRAYSLGESVSSIVGLSLGLMDASILTFGATLGQQLGYLIPATIHEILQATAGPTLGQQLGYLIPATIHEILQATAGPTLGQQSWVI